MDSPLHLDRRRFLGSAAAAGSAAAFGGIAAIAPATPALAGPAGFPSYQFLRECLDVPSLAYNPTNEFIFPCIRGVYDKVTNYLGRYYLYYAPHNNPGGICLAYSDSLEGQFTEYADNPIISNDWPPYYTPAQAPHVSSPHVLWNKSMKQFFLYFHGDNATTRLAISSDGINFSYHGKVLHSTWLPGANINEASYARVFQHPLASKGSTYVMVFMGYCKTDSKRKIYWGWSADGKAWSYSDTPLVSPTPDGVNDLSGPHLLYRNSTTYVAYHGGSGKMYLTEVGNNFDREVHLGVFHTPLVGAPDYKRSAAPSFAGNDYMFYEAGQRGSSRIAVAKRIS